MQEVSPLSKTRGGKESNSNELAFDGNTKHRNSTTQTNNTNHKRSETLSSLYPFYPTMPCFSFSAPSVSPEQERKEREELGAEYQEILDEMHGRASAPTPLKLHDSQFSLEDVQAEIDKMPDSEKKYFLQAMECAPNLVETESNHLFYQSSCQSHEVSGSRQNLNQESLFNAL